MPNRELYVPSPQTVSTVDFQLLSNISKYVMLDYGMDETFYVSELMKGETHEDTKNFIENVRPIARLAIDDYEEEFQTDATFIRLGVDNYRPKTKPGIWHRDPQFPCGRMYAVSNADSTEFAYGEGLPYINRLPGRLPINTLVKGLIRTGRLKVQHTQPNTLTKFDGRHLHRRPAIYSKSRVGLQMSIYSRELALDGIVENKLLRFQMWLATRKDRDLYY